VKEIRIKFNEILLDYLKAREKTLDAEKEIENK